MPRGVTHRLPIRLEEMEPRTLTTMVFLLNGNAYAAAPPNALTAGAAADLARRGFTPIQVSYPDMNGIGPFVRLANSLVRASKGQPIGLVGFSAGGTLAMRLASYPGLNVSSVLSFYGPPDLSAWLNDHRGDAAFRLVSRNTDSNPAFINSMSGPSETTTHIVAAFGTIDHTVHAAAGARSLTDDFPHATIYTYNGPHGVPIRAQPAAYADFLNHLPPTIRRSRPQGRISHSSIIFLCCLHAFTLRPLLKSLQDDAQRNPRVVM
ncbi:dienelactone hydrolase family protein [Aquisphaera insulae]|uniref:dienelactone hydrolase family protein n=1 Tax=Aquisphaera insulae TaxID=2712864 RepID=UPI0013EC26AB|nr:dienelactone hydrolase family protein [Aquisphaera insulae]